MIQSFKNCTVVVNVDRRVLSVFYRGNPLLHMTGFDVDTKQLFEDFPSLGDLTIRQAGDNFRDMREVEIKSLAIQR